jgi:hypothetical protein
MGEPKDKVQQNGAEVWTYYSSSGRTPRADNFFRPTGMSLPSSTYEKNYDYSPNPRSIFSLQPSDG